MPGPLQGKLARQAMDLGLAVGLATLLLTVYFGDLLLRRPSSENGGGTLTTTPPTTIEQVTTKPLRLAVTPPEFDDMGELLKQLGAGYKFSTITLAALEKPAGLAQVDILFFTCGQSQNLPSTIKDNLRRFVAKGGTLYASDLRFDVVAEAFPEFVDPVANTQGIQQDVKAEVVDSGLRQALGAEMPLHFDQDGWRPAAFKGAGVQVFLQGTIQTNAGIAISCPLLVRFPFQEGNVVFTSFHNEKQQKGLEEKLLRHLVMLTVTAREQSRVSKTMVSGGFSPQAHNLLSTSAGNLKVSQSYYNKDVSRLQFVLGFEDQGAQLRLEVRGPDGQKFAKEGPSTFALDVPKAMAGEWHYTITALQVPYPNFPFTLTVGSTTDSGKQPGKEVAVQPLPIDPRVKGSLVFKEITPVEKMVRTTKRLRLAVTPRGSDDMAVVLRNLGSGYQFTNIGYDVLADEVRISEYDVIFLNCGANPVGRPEVLRRFVANGGFIYASDLQFTTLANTFPELVSQKHVDNANPQFLDAEVLDAGLKEVIGPTMKIHFNAGGWRPAAFAGREVNVLVAGSYVKNFGNRKEAPLLVQFPVEKGTVVFTSFHNVAQEGGTVKKVLEYLVFTAVTAQVQTVVTKTMEASGFFPKQGGLFTHSAGNPKITRNYSNKKIGPLQFALGLQNQGARMKFTITAPNGQKFEKEVKATLTVEVANAPLGDWLYTVEALEVPYANFPFTVTVGEKQKE